MRALVLGGTIPPEAVLCLVLAFGRVSVTRRRFFGPSKSCVSLRVDSGIGCDKSLLCDDKDRLPDACGTLLFVMVQRVRRRLTLV
jgi:hypothetical protein